MIVGQPSWVTPVRKNRLEKMVRIASGKKHIKLLLVNCQGGYRKANTIYIGTQYIPNKVFSGISDDLWMLVVQRAIAMHELGHVFWTDWNTSKKVYEEIRNTYGTTVAQIYREVRNFIEDARVDRAIAQEFPGAGFYIRKLRENDSKIAWEKIQRGSLKLQDPLSQYYIFLYDTLIYNSGIFEWLVQQGHLHPVTRKLIEETSDLVSQALKEPNPKKVPYIYWKIAVKVYEILSREINENSISVWILSPNFGCGHSLDSEGSHSRILRINDEIDLKQKFNEMVNRQSKQEEKSSEGENTDESKDEDISEDTDENEDKLKEELTDQEKQGEEGDDEFGESNDSEGEQSELEDGTDSDGGITEEGTEETEGSENCDEEEQILRELARELAQEQRELRENIFEPAYKDMKTDYYHIPIEYGTPNYNAWRQFSEDRIRSTGTIIARNLLTMLHEKVKGKFKPGFKSGRLHTKSLWKLQRNDYRIFKRKEKEKELNYQCFILLDRSGSMRTENRIYKAVYATLILCYALEKVGIQTEVLGFNDHEITIHKQLEEKFETAKYKIADLSADGWTPTHIALNLVKQRIKKLAKKNPFIIIVTDGQPDSVPKTIDEIETCPYPVIGVTISCGSNIGWEKIYHAESKVLSVDDLLPALTQLVKKLMF